MGSIFSASPDACKVDGLISALMLAPSHYFFELCQWLSLCVQLLKP